MAKKKISKRQKNLGTGYLTKHIPFSSKEMKDPKIVADVLLQCIREGDAEAFRDVLVSHLITANKSKIARKAGLGRRTLYDLLDPKKDFNPGFETISALIRAIAA